MEDYQRGYHNDLYQVQRQYGFRNRNVPLASNQKKQNAQVYAHHKETVASNQSKDKGPIVPNHVKGNKYSSSGQRKYKEFQEGGQKKASSQKYQLEKKYAPLKEVEKHYALFSLANEISKLKVSIALIEIVKNDK